MIKTINFISLGCPRNLVDTEVMLGIVLKSGYAVIDDITKADYFIINTCGFISEARRETVEAIKYILSKKKESAKLIVTGCMLQNHLHILQDYFSNKIHYFLGSGDISNIINAIENQNSGMFISEAKSFLESKDTPRRISTPRHYAYLKVAEGCSKQCAYCIIPSIKGPLRSKSKDQILKEFNCLLDQGFFEIILIAQDLGDYGRDLGIKKALPDLLKSILSIKRDFWLRLLYMYPDEFTNEIIKIMKSDDRICKYIDIPIQHVNDAILRKMCRSTTKKQIISIIEKLRLEIPDVTIRTNFIVGLPGETDDHFNELIDFIKKYPIDQLGVFKYSPEIGSSAYKMLDQVPEDIKTIRYNKIMKAQLEILRKRNFRMKGKRVTVIVEGYHPESHLLMVGRHSGQCPDIDSNVIINDGRKVDEFGKKYIAEITSFSDYDLIARILHKI